MLRSAAIVFASLVFAFSVLGTSVLRTTQPTYVFSGEGNVAGTNVASPSATVDYYLPYPGILPDHFLWPFKALRDRVWLFLTRDPGKRAELLLLFADKRIGMAEALIRGGKAELGVGTATKAEKYLEKAFLQQERAEQAGVDTGDFLERLAKASLKHREILEELMSVVPEDARPVINETLDYPKRVYEKSAHGLNERGRPVPPIINPSAQF